MEDSKISWTKHTFNPWIGCAKVNTGCLNCYAEALMDTRYGTVEWGEKGTRKRTGGANWAKPKAWNRAAEKSGERHRVFCASLADVFEDRSDLLQWRHQLFDLIDGTPHLDWLLLTKRPENITRMWSGGVRPNVWLGTSIADQKTADAGIRLLQARHLSPVLFLSCEPLVGPLNLRRVGYDLGGRIGAYDLLGGYRGTDIQSDWRHVDEFGVRNASIDWVIVGGESGGGARICQSSWLLDIREQCFNSSTPFWMKQLGSVSDLPAKGKGDDREEWPDSLKVQMVPGC